MLSTNFVGMTYKRGKSNSYIKNKIKKQISNTKYYINTQMKEKGMR